MAIGGRAEGYLLIPSNYVRASLYYEQLRQETRGFNLDGCEIVPSIVKVDDFCKMDAKDTQGRLRFDDLESQRLMSLSDKQTTDAFWGFRCE